MVLLHRCEVIAMNFKHIIVIEKINCDIIMYE